MKSTIILSTTNNNSLSKEIVESLVSKLNRNNANYEIIDLYKDNFNPVMSQNQEKLYENGDTDCDLVKKYQDILKNTDEIILVFPLWFNNVPAILKGFFDKVLLKGFAFKEESNDTIGLLTNIKSGLVISTSESSDNYLKEMGNPIETVVVRGTLGVCGIENVEYINVNSENKSIHFEKYFK